MENYNYKAVVFGKSLYQEIVLQGDYKNEVVLGTTGRSKIRFDRHRFFEDFEVELFCDGDKWRISCSSNIYIESDSALKLYSMELSHGDEVEIRYESSKTSLFKISFTIDFDDVCSDYNKVYDVSAVSSMEIGGTDFCTIKINNELVGDDYIVLTRQGEEFIVDDSHTKYGIYINGFKNKEKTAVIQNYDFFMLDGASFYFKDNRLYTDSEKNGTQSKLKCTYAAEQSNAMVYPQFRKNVRIHKIVPDRKIKILPPEPKPEKNNENIAVTLLPTLISFIAMLVLRSMMRGNKMFVIYCAITMGMGIVTSIISYVNSKKQYKKDVEDRKNEYKEYLKKKEKEIVNARKQEKEILEDIYIDSDTEMAQIMSFDRRLFERDMSDDDYLVVRLGSGKVKAGCGIEITEKECIKSGDPLSELPEVLAREYEYIPDAPVTVDLKKCNGIGIVGSSEAQYNMLKLITVDMAARQYFEDVKFYYIFDEAYESIFSNLRWLQNIYLSDAPVRNMVYEEQGKKIILEYLYSELSRRESMNQDELKDVKHHVVFVYSADAFFVHPISQYIRQAKELKFTFLFFDEKREFIPQYVDKLILLDTPNSGVLIDAENSDIREHFTFDTLDDENLKKAVLRLGCIQIQSVNLESKLTKSISLFKLLNIMSVSDMNIGERWNTSRIYESMAAPLGVMANGNILYLDLHEKKHGPHGLVAGTTGSGKSEILQSYILSMASLYHPYDVGFVIIDFKGGGMVNQFKDLPHLIGSITNIDGREIERSLLSIKAELKKRQTIFADAGVNHIDAYIKLFKKGEVNVPLPHLILIVDEFAELKREQPDFMKELVSAARIGRSLGVHLILATQKPTGVVDDQIWSNSKFRLCLKVQNKNDSNEVLKSPVAAEIKEPGRAYLQVGNNELFELFQSAYSGLGVDEEHTGKEREYKIYELNLAGMRKTIFEQAGKKEGEQKQTQLDAVVSYISKYCSDKNIMRLSNICLDSLSKCISFDEKRLLNFDGFDIGIYDDPDNQYQGSTKIDIDAKNTVIIGSSQYGKTNLLQLLIRQIAIKYTPKEANIYILDFGSMVLKNFENLNHVCGVVCSSDDEKLKNLFKLLIEEIAMRKEKLVSIGVSSFLSYVEAGKKDLPHIYIFIDNMTALMELYLENDDTLLNIIREGLSVGISVIMANAQVNGIGYRYISNFANKIALYCNDSNEYGNLFEHVTIRLDEIPGRLILEIEKRTLECQSYLSFAGDKEFERIEEIKKFVMLTNKKNSGYTAKKIPFIPGLLTKDVLEKDFSVVSRGYVMTIGLSYKEVNPFYLDFAKLGAIGLCGKENKGHKNFIGNLLRQLDDNASQYPVKAVILDDVSRKFKEYAKLSIVEDYTLNCEEVLEKITKWHQMLEERYQAMMSESKIVDDSLLLLIIQNNDITKMISEDLDVMNQYSDIISRFKAFNVCIIYANYENTVLSFDAPEPLRMIKTAQHIMLFDDLEELKVFEVPYEELKSNKKKLMQGDAYYIKDTSVTKLKLIKADS